ncbi:ABC transporter ATP-binding protein [Sulfitobacter noctilucae]|nr:ABC transporter ATP-binding protein [Sulfitobacter noctilucae]
MAVLPKYTANFSPIKLEFERVLSVPAEQIMSASQRKNRLAKIFQEPMTSLDPSCTIVNQISETILSHQEGSKTDARARRLSMLKRMGMENFKTRLFKDPHQSSSGTRQRAMIAASFAEFANLLRIGKDGASRSRVMAVSQ